MAPNVKDTDFLEAVKEIKEPLKPAELKRKYTILYHVALILAYLHIGALYGVYLAFTSAKWATIVFNVFMYITGGLGIAAGVHRLWSHRAYKANMPLQILLMLMHTTSGQTTVINWARDHRVHHKYCDTDADPYSSVRGLFYSHIGWILVKRHPDCVQKGKEIDISDLLQNPVLRFQKKYYAILSLLTVFILPTLIPMYFWNETMSNAFYVHLDALVPGFLSLSLGLSFAISFGSRHGLFPTVVGFVVGALFLIVTVLGYCGAIKENRVMLYVYSGIMAVSAVINLLLLVLIQTSDMTVNAGPILNIGGAILSLSLAVILAGLTRKGVNQGCVLSPPPTSYTPNI